MRIMTIGLVAAAGFAGVVSIADAGITGDAVQFQVNSSTGETGFWRVRNDAAPWINGRWDYTNPQTVQIRSSTSGNLLATIDQVSLSYDQDPIVTVNFAVTAANANTTFTITSGLLNFPVFNAIARATASATVTDTDGNGAFVNGLYGGDLYRANYNGAIPGPTQFTTLVSSMGAGSFSGNSRTQSTPGGPGFIPIGPVSSMQASFSFVVSANDQASGSSTFITIPTPGGMIVLSLAGLAAARRRR